MEDGYDSSCGVQLGRERRGERELYRPMRVPRAHMRIQTSVSSKQAYMVSEEMCGEKAESRPDGGPEQIRSRGSGKDLQKYRLVGPMDGVNSPITVLLERKHLRELDVVRIEVAKRGA